MPTADDVKKQILGRGAGGYTYCNNNPVTFVDPDGRRTQAINPQPPTPPLPPPVQPVPTLPPNITENLGEPPKPDLSAHLWMIPEVHADPELEQRLQEVLRTKPALKRAYDAARQALPGKFEQELHQRGLCVRDIDDPTKQTKVEEAGKAALSAAGVTGLKELWDALRDNAPTAPSRVEIGPSLEKSEDGTGQQFWLRLKLKF